MLLCMSIEVTRYSRLKFITHKNTTSAYAVVYNKLQKLLKTNVADIIYKTCFMNRINNAGDIEAELFVQRCKDHMCWSFPF